MQTTRSLLALLIVTLGLAAVPDATFAYGGPGSVISGIGALLAALAALLASLFGFVWFPLKRLVRKLRGENSESAQATADPKDE